MASMEMIKMYWMSTMAESETFDEMEQVWGTEDGMADLMHWFDEELKQGLTEEEMVADVRDVLVITPVVINSNMLYYNGTYWVLESADDSWGGYELYESLEYAIKMAMEPNFEEEELDMVEEDEE